jgi:D-alanyl-D-alanine carboxypeptidase
LRGTTTDHPAPAASPSVSDRRVATATRRGDVEIQIGAYADESEARARLRAVLASNPGVLSGAMPVTPVVRVGGRTLYRARFSGLDAATAASACTALRRHQVDCLVTRSE